MLDHSTGWPRRRSVLCSLITRRTAAVGLRPRSGKLELIHDRVTGRGYSGEQTFDREIDMSKQHR